MNFKCIFFFLLFLFPLLTANGQANATDSLRIFDIPSQVHTKRIWLASGASTVAYTGTMLALNKAWYEDFPKTKFHTFNDWGEWENMDKAGHVFSAYAETALAYRAARWTGLKSKPSSLIAFGVSTLIQGSIEWLDGHSDRWGWSWHDIAANTLGSAIYASQQIAWEEQRIRLKFSYSGVNHSKEEIKAFNSNMTSSKFDRAQNQFGKSFPEQLLKDYGGQTYWLSINPSGFLSKENKFPDFLNIALGYGVNNVLGAYGNNWSVGNNQFRPENFNRERQYYLSLDLDLRKIKTKNKFLRWSLNTLNIIKIPSPSLEFNSNGKTYWHWIYF